MKTGKIAYIDLNGKWKEYNKYKVTFADGNNYTFFALGDFKFKVGETISYEVTNAEYRNAKILKDQYKNNESTNAIYRDKNDLIIRQTCIKASAHYNSQRNVGTESVINDAELMFNWIKS